jgi:hypothetical protein
LAAIHFACYNTSAITLEFIYAQIFAMENSNMKLKEYENITEVVHHGDK